MSGYKFDEQGGFDVCKKVKKMSSIGESPDGGLALQSHYSLRWNNHQTHILQAFEALLHAEILVDVTLVCSESSIRAHKVVLSACR